MYNKSLHNAASRVEKASVGNDNILAHLNPMEAMQLARQHGYSINPHDGLPQFGFWDTFKPGGGVYKVTHRIAKGMFNILPHAAGLLGAVVGGPAGAGIGELVGNGIGMAGNALLGSGENSQAAPAQPAIPQYDYRHDLDQLNAQKTRRNYYAAQDKEDQQAAQNARANHYMQNAAQQDAENMMQNYNQQYNPYEGYY